ncbi:MAG: hypothetical protein ACI4WW_06695 [Candidatus Coprovivens sp.]
MFNYKELIKNQILNLVDELNRLIIVLLIIAIIISIFISSFIIDIIPFILLFILIFRLTSKNKVQRNKENKKYMNIKNIIIKPFNVIIKNIKDKEHVYKRCSKCHTIAKLPLPPKKGILHAKCPNCKKRLTIFTFKEEKIEIIKKAR